MSVTAIVAAAFVLATFGWIIIDSVRSGKKDKVMRIQHDTGRVFLAARLKESGVVDVETKVRRQVEDIVRMSPAPSAPPHPEITPSGMLAVDPNSDETRCMKAVREKSEEVDRLAKKKAGA